MFTLYICRFCIFRSSLLLIKKKRNCVAREMSQLLRHLLCKLLNLNLDPLEPIETQVLGKVETVDLRAI